ncbi:short transient receptor potential channel 6 [Trichonephila clavipes]|nr:short transient receptor potential channel 6 [Trichonephila clavipes]
MLKHENGSDTSTRTQTSEWYRRFRVGRESVKDDERSWCPQNSSNSHAFGGRTVNKELYVGNLRRLFAVTPHSADRNRVETGSYTRWNNQAYGSVHRGTDPRHRFQSRGNHGQQHQSHMVRFNGRQQFNSQPRQFVQQNRYNFRPPRNDENIQRQGWQLIIDSMDDKGLDQVPDSPEADLKRLFNTAMVVEDTVPKQTLIFISFGEFLISLKYYFYPLGTCQSGLASLAVPGFSEGEEIVRYDFCMHFFFISTFIFWLVSLLNSVSDDVNKAKMERKLWYKYDPTLVHEGFYAIASVLAAGKFGYYFLQSSRLGPLQDGAPVHFCSPVRDWLDMTYSGSWIECGGWSYSHCDHQISHC